jgi:hypothetical protein
MKTFFFFIIGIVMYGYTAAQSACSTPTTNVQMLKGYYIFWPGQKPNCPYDYVGSVQTPGVVKTLKAEHMLNVLIEKAIKENFKGSNYALIVTDEDIAAADVVKLKE